MLEVGNNSCSLLFLPLFCRITFALNALNTYLCKKCSCNWLITWQTLLKGCKTQNMIIPSYTTQWVAPGKQILEVLISYIRKWFEWWIAHSESALPGIVRVQLGRYITHTPHMHKHTQDTQTWLCLTEKDVNEMLASSERYHGWPNTKIHCVLRIGFDKYMMACTNFTLLNTPYPRLVETAWVH